MIKNNQKIDYTTFKLAQFNFRDEKKKNILVYLLGRLMGSEWLAAPIVLNKQITLQSIGEAIGFDKTVSKNLFAYHERRLKLQKIIDWVIYMLSTLTIAQLFILPIIYLFGIFPPNLIPLLSVVLILFLFVAIGVANRFSYFVTLRYFPDSMCIQSLIYLVLDLARCQNPLTPYQKKNLLGRITFLLKGTRLLINQYNLNTRTLNWAKKHFQQIESFIQEREKWIIAPIDSTLEDLQQDFYNLALIYLTGNLGNFEYDNEVDLLDNNPNNNFKKFIIGIPRVVFGVMIPISGLLIISLRPDLITNIIDIKVLGLICVGWLLLAIDVILKLGIVSSVIGIAKGIKDLS